MHRRTFLAASIAALALPSTTAADLRLAASGATDGDVLSALLATTYQTSTSLLLKQHDQGNAWLAVGRAMAEAERSGDPVVLASSVRVQAHVLAREKHTAQAVTLVRHTVDQLTGSYGRRPPKYLAAVGLLLLRGVTAASGGGDRAATEEFLAEAKEVARYVSLDRPDAWANFSPTNVALHELSALVAFGDAGLALQAARPLMRRHIPVPERRAALWVETARAYSQQGRLADGYQALRIAETCAAPEKKPLLYVVVCACGIAGDVGKLITAAQERHWDVGVVATPQGLGFLDTEAIEAQTGYPVRSAWRTPGEARPLPPADAIAVAPASQVVRLSAGARLVPQAGGWAPAGFDGVGDYAPVPPGRERSVAWRQGGGAAGPCPAGGLRLADRPVRPGRDGGRRVRLAGVRASGGCSRCAWRRRPR